MPINEFYESYFCDQIEPFGDRRLDLLFGMLSVLIANVNRDPKTKPQPYKPDDFMIQWDPKPEVRQTEKQIFAFMKFIQAAQNARMEAAESSG